MNKIFNWTLGSFFRTLGRVLAFCVIGYIISIILSSSDIKLPRILQNFLLIDIVKADSVLQYSSVKIEVQQCTANTLADHQEFGTCVWDNRTCMGSNCTIQFGSDNGHLKKIQFEVFGGSNNTYPAGTYNAVIRVAQDPLHMPTLNYVYVIKVFGNTTSSATGADSSSNTISSKSCFLEQVSTYNFDIKCSFSTTKDLKFFNISLEAKSNEHVPLNTDKIFWYSIEQFTYTTDPSGAINQQTTIIQNEFNTVNDNINSLKDEMGNQTQQIIDSNKVCSIKDLTYSDTISNGVYLNSSGGFISSTPWGITDYLEVNQLEIISSTTYNSQYSCFYTENKTLISCISASTSVGVVSLPTNTFYIRFSIRNNDVPKYRVSLCKNGNQAMQDTLNDDEVGEATSEASDFFSSFTTNTHGLTGIITAPLNAIQSLTSSTCSPLVLPLPFVDEDLTLPCMRQIYVDNFGSFMTIYDTITLGIVSYWVSVRIFALVKDFKNPDHDEVEVVDL